MFKKVIARQISEALETTFSERVYFQKSLLFRGGGGILRFKMGWA